MTISTGSNSKPMEWYVSALGDGTYVPNKYFHSFYSQVAHSFAIMHCIYADILPTPNQQ